MLFRSSSSNSTGWPIRLDRVCARNAATTRRSCRLLVDDEFDRVACDCDLDWICYVRSAAAFADEDFVDEYDEAAETAIQHAFFPQTAPIDVVRPRQSEGRVPQVDLEGEDVRAGSIGRLTSKDLPRFGPSS